MNYNNNLKSALKFVSKSEARLVLTGVYHKENGQLIATDSHRIIIIENGHNGEHAGDIINKNGEIVTGNYPDVGRVIPNSDGSKITIDIKKWIQIHTQIKKENKESKQIRLVLPDDMKMIFQSIHKGLIENEYSFDFLSACKVNIVYNLDYILDILKTLKSLGYKECTLTIKNKMFPILFTVNDENVLILLMPIRLGEEPRHKTAADIEAIINEGDLIEFTDIKYGNVKTEVIKIKRKYFHIVINGKEYKVPKDKCKKVS